MAIKNRYIITDSKTKTQCDLEVKEEVIFSKLDKAWENPQRICSIANESSSIPSSSNQKSRSNAVKKILSQKLKPKRQCFSLQKPLGPRTKCVTSVISGQPKSEDIIANCWKLTGRRITHNELLKGVNLNITRLLHCLGGLKNFANQQERAVSTLAGAQKGQLETMVARLSRGLAVVEQALKNADDVRQTMQSTFSQAGQRDEPIVQVHFPGQLHWMQDLPFCSYEQSWAPEQLKFTAERYVIAEDPVWNANIATLKLGDNLVVTVTPLADLEETVAFNADGAIEEIRKGDVVPLLWQVTVIVEAEGTGTSFYVEAFLKLMSVTRGAIARTRRRAAAKASQSGRQEAS
jgi:hypothetical protein